MKDIIINQIIIPVAAAAIGTILELARRQLKKYLDSKQELIEKQKEALQQSIGIDQYNKDKAVVQDAVKTVEQLGKEFDWQGTLKHSKVLEMIEGKTGLTDDEIFNIIKAAVLEVNNIKTQNIAVVKN
ncbi:hypothetical protein IAI10_13855 [Clostridium sp. 19966]|uniref:hypothetical protein n=1 Tax=Clostridium sp. 19966 TaxID=2768166 RepID=UPI0028DF083B|nr:hypothetical protein [Clostridium sp. 19966]MDT8717749.1 hypothetical protein [Clostridium sp. 19966]